MKLQIIKFFIFALIFLHTCPVWCQETEKKAALSTDEIINQVEKRYGKSGFSAHFDQLSTIKAMDIKDNAYGNLYIKHPGKMRWEYEMPEEQTIITDGKTLWIYRPEDNQVMIGNATEYFGNGKGASFLSDIKLIREKFDVTRVEEKDTASSYMLKLLPREKKFDIVSVYISIAKDTYEVRQITTYNSYEDETRIDLSNFELNQNIDDRIFDFVIPEGTDILQLEE